MKNEVNPVFYISLLGFLSGVILSGAIAIGINFHRSRLYRKEIAGLNEKIREYGERAQRYSAEIESERNRIMGLRNETAAGLKDCREIEDAVGRIRRQVEILEEYYVDSEPCMRGRNCIPDIYGKKRIGD